MSAGAGISGMSSLRQIGVPALAVKAAEVLELAALLAERCGSPASITTV